METFRPSQRRRVTHLVGLLSANSKRYTIGMFVALSKFVVANAMSSEIAAAFRGRPHLVDSTPGFVRLDVISPEGNPNEFWLITYWTSRSHFETWHKGCLYRESHSEIPKGLKLVPRATSLTFFDHVAS